MKSILISKPYKLAINSKKCNAMLLNFKCNKANKFCTQAPLKLCLSETWFHLLNLYLDLMEISGLSQDLTLMETITYSKTSDILLWDPICLPGVFVTMAERSRISEDKDSPLLWWDRDRLLTSFYPSWSYGLLFHQGLVDLARSAILIPLGE